MPKYFWDRGPKPRPPTMEETLEMVGNMLAWQVIEATKNGTGVLITQEQIWDNLSEEGKDDLVKTAFIKLCGLSGWDPVRKMPE